MSLPSRAALLLIDVQLGLDDPRWGARNNPMAEQRITDLLPAWRTSGRPVVNCAFIGTELEAHLRANGIEALVMVGITTDHCV